MLPLRVSSQFTEECARKGIRSRRFARLVWTLLATACTNPQYQDQSPDAEGAKDEVAADAGSGRDQATPPDASVSESSKLTGEAGATSLGGDAAVANPPADAAMLSEPSGQTGAPAAPQPAVFPSWATPLLGTYALQTHSFSADNYAGILKSISRLEELSLVHIERVGEGAEMRSKLCRYRAEGKNDYLVMNDASGLPEIRRAVSFGEDKSWSTDALPWGVGYNRDVPAECVGKENQQVPKRPGQQAWLTAGTCLCPSSAQVGPRFDDCRVSDPDNDRKPGLTFSMKGTGALAAILDEVFQAVLIDRSHLVAGRIDPSGTNHYGNRVVDGIAYQFPCTTSNCSLVSDVARPCTSEHNGMRFHRLEQQSGEPAWTCEQILANLATLFPMALPGGPTTCSQEILTDDPNRR